ncbi:MAG TPA: hypothetical protein VEZ49_00115 [Gemmatimonadales bacterium]|nr:hypothetical protein [Gemmatimonadales bacterium]
MVTIRVVALLLLLATPLRAQSGSASGMMSAAVRAYRDLDFDAAAGLLRRVLTPPLANGIDITQRARALTYLAAAEHYRGRQDSAIAVFQRLVALAPGQRPDTLIFPPEITQLYDAVQTTVPLPRPIAVAAPDTLPRFQAPLPAPPPPPPAPPSPPAVLQVPLAAPPADVIQDNAPAIAATAAGQVLSARGVTALGFFGSARFHRLELDVRYAEGQRQALVEGAVALRFLATSWLSVQLGPHARRFDTPFGAERWLTWRLGGRGDLGVAGTGVSGHALLWRALGVDVNVPPGSGSASGGEVGVTLDLGSRPFWFALAYGIDQAQVRNTGPRETVKTLTLTVGLRRR